MQKQRAAFCLACSSVLRISVKKGRDNRKKKKDLGGRGVKRKWGRGRGKRI